MGDALPSTDIGDYDAIDLDAGQNHACVVARDTATGSIY